MIFVTDSTGNATYVSREWGEWTGQTLEDAVDYGWSKVVHPDDLTIVRTIVADAIHARIEFGVRYRLLSPDGRSTWVAAGAVPSFGPPDRTFLGFVGSIALISDPPAEGLTAGALLGQIGSPAAPRSHQPGSVLERVADHLILAHALILQDDGTCALAAVEAALHAIGHELAKVAQGDREGSILH